MDDVIKVYTNNKGAKSIIFENYTYRFFRKNKNSGDLVWRCNFKLCSVMVTTSECATVFIKQNKSEHNHENKEIDSEIKEIRCAVKRKSQLHLHEKPSKIIRQELCMSSVSTNNIDAMRQSIYRERRKLLQSAPLLDALKMAKKSNITLNNASTFKTKIKEKIDCKNNTTFPTPSKSLSTQISQNYKIKINSNESPSFFESDSDASNISTPPKVQSDINKGPAIIGEGIPIQSSSKTASSPSRNCNKELINSKCTNQRIPNNTELILKEILKGQTIILQKLDQIMDSQISTSMEHTNSLNNTLNNDNLFSRKLKDMFPMTNNNDILKVENSLNDHNFYQYVAQRLQFTGGMCLQQFVTRVMDTLFSGPIFVALNFSGRKKKQGDPDKLGFSKLTLYRLICQDVCYKKFPHINQDKIDFYLKSWIRHSKEKFERVNNIVIPAIQSQT